MPHMHLAVSDLGPDEVERAYALVQKNESPEAIIHELRGQGAELLDPDQFTREVQSRCQELHILYNPEGDEDERT
ncbi:MAG: hypothetical protein ABIG34_01330 [Candidatus Peregrinibacteria bacterium]